MVVLSGDFEVRTTKKRETSGGGCVARQMARGVPRGVGTTWGPRISVGRSLIAYLNFDPLYRKILLLWRVKFVSVM